MVDALSVGRGESLAVIGPSGSGKTTLLHLIAGILMPESGKIVVVGESLAEKGDAARREFRLRQIGLVFQEFELVEHLRVIDNILLPLRLSSSLQLTDEMRSRAEQLATQMGLGDKIRRYPRQLSQGERQRVAIGRALLLQPPLLLCDEPTGNLDPENKEHVLDVLFDYAARYETTILTVTHDHQLLPRFGRTVDFETFRRSPARA